MYLVKIKKADPQTFLVYYRPHKCTKVKRYLISKEVYQDIISKFEPAPETTEEEKEPDFRNLIPEILTRKYKHPFGWMSIDEAARAVAVELGISLTRARDLVMFHGGLDYEVLERFPDSFRLKADTNTLPRHLARRVKCVRSKAAGDILYITERVRAFLQIHAPRPRPIAHANMLIEFDMSEVWGAQPHEVHKALTLTQEQNFIYLDSKRDMIWLLERWPYNSLEEWAEKAGVTPDYIITKLGEKGLTFNDAKELFVKYPRVEVPPQVLETDNPYDPSWINEPGEHEQVEEGAYHADA